MTSQLSSLLEQRRLDDLLAVAAEGNLSNVKMVNMFGRNTDIDTSAEDVTDLGGNYTPPTAARVHAIVSSSAEDGDDSAQSTGTITVDHYDAMLAAAATGTITVVDWALAAIIKATGTLTFNSPADGDTCAVDGTTFTKATAVAATGEITYGAPDNGDTVEVNSVVFTKVASSPGALQFSTIGNLTSAIDALPNVSATHDGTTITIVAATVGTGGNAYTLALDGDNTGTMAVSGAGTLAGGVSLGAAEFQTIGQLTTLINALPNVNATDNGTVITIEAAVGGTGGNSITLAETGAMTKSGTTLAGGRAAATITVNGTTLTANVDFVAATDNTTTAENLKNAIHAIAGVSATRSGLVITITADAADETGNSIGLATSVTGFATRSGATLTGGEGLCTVVVNGVSFVAGVDFTPGASNTAAAQSLKAAINASTDPLIDGILTASGSGATLTITADTGGTVGDSITLACADTDSVTVSGATLSGGDNENITGVRSVRITGVDATYAEITEDIDLNGTGSKNTVNSYLRINSMVALAVGSNGSAVGNITATAATDGTVSAKILAGKCESQNAYYTVPLNKTGFLMSVFASLPALGAVTAQLAADVREYGKGWVTRALIGASGEAIPVPSYVFPAPIVVPAKSDIRLRANTSADNTDVIAGAQLLVVAVENA